MSDFRSEFDDDDDFNVDDNDDFNFPEDEGDFVADNQQDFDFGGDEEEFTFDEGGLDLDDEVPELEEVDGEREGGTSRTFIIIAALMILLFVGGLAAVVLLGTNQGPSPFELTSAAIETANAEVQVALNASATQSFVNGQTQTAEALFTPTPTPTEAPTRAPTITPTPTLDATQQAALALTSQVLTQTSVALTDAAATPTGQSVEDVQLTATALALLLGQGGGPTPTAEVLTPGTPGTPSAPRPTALPDTGLFDDLAASGSGSTGMLALMAFGLIAVIIVSRRLRATNNRP
jgi:hypothetical protein